MSVQCDNHPKSLFTSLEAEVFKNSSLPPDVVLQCEDKKFHVNKKILCQTSPFLNSYFQKLENLHKKTVCIDFWSASVLEVILFYSYTGFIVLPDKSEEFLKNLTEMSIVLRIPEIYNKTLLLLLEIPSYDMLISKCQKVDELNSIKIKLIFIKNLIKSLSTLKETWDFLNLDVEHLLSIIQHSATIASVKQEELLDCVVVWVEYKEDRQKHLAQLLNQINLKEISDSYLANFCSKPLLTRNDYFQKEIRRRVLLPQFKMNTTIEDFSSERKIVKTSHPDSLQSLMDIKIKPLPEAKTYECINMSSIKVNVIKESGVHVVTAMGNLTVDRREASSNICNLIKTIDCTTRVAVVKKRRRKAKNQKDSSSTNEDDHSHLLRRLIDCGEEVIQHPDASIIDFATCSHKNYRYLFGGRKSMNGQPTGAVNDCYFFDTVKNIWCKGAKMITARFGATAIEFEDQIYVVGGMKVVDNNHCPLTAFERYNPAKDQWCSLKKLPTPCCSPAAVVAGQQLFVLANTKIIWYESQKAKWEQGPKLPEALVGTVIRAVENNGKLFVISYYHGNTLYEFQVENQTWKGYKK